MFLQSKGHQARRFTDYQGILHLIKPDIRHTIRSVASATPSRESVGKFVFLCQKIARSHLLVKLRSEDYARKHFGLSLDDLAMDSVAGLFQTNSQGVLVQVESYFASIDVEYVSEQDLLSHLRRIVFSKVNIHLMDLRSQLDPSFWKVLRNVKLGVQALRTFTEVERLGDIYLVPADTDALDHLPPIGEADLQHVLFTISSSHSNIPTLLSKLSRYLREQSEHSRMIHIITLASAIRAVYTSGMESANQSAESPDGLTPDEITGIVKAATRKIDGEMRQTYVDRKGTTEELYSAYRTTIEQYLLCKFVPGDAGNDGSLLVHFQHLHPEITKDVYHSDHRGKVEYLLRLIEQEVVSQLKKQYK